MAAGTHTALPLPDRDLLVVLDEAVLDNQEDGEKLIWLFDIREPSNPVSISTFPQPMKPTTWRKGAFRPHNLHENRPGLCQLDADFCHLSERGRAGILTFPIRIDRWKRCAGARRAGENDGHAAESPQVIQSCDVFVDAQGIIYSTDYNGGLSVIEYLG